MPLEINRELKYILFLEFSSWFLGIHLSAICLHLLTNEQVAMASDYL